MSSFNTNFSSSSQNNLKIILIFQSVFGSSEGQIINMDNVNDDVHLNYSNDIPANATCRICRGEATEDNLLFHPCKCKGSIKYLHEPCLNEWIAARNLNVNNRKSIINCDICHYPFQFKTKYVESMPEKIPLSILIKDFLLTNIKKISSIAIFACFSFLIVIGIPLVWNIFGKLMTFALDGELPIPGHFWQSLLIGYKLSNGNKNEDWIITISKSVKFSLFQIFLVIILHAGLYFQYDMIIREDVFTKMVFHKIGPNFSIVELKNRLKERFPVMDEQMLEQVAKMMRDREKLEHEQRLDQEQRDLERQLNVLDNNGNDDIVGDVFEREVNDELLPENNEDEVHQNREEVPEEPENEENEQQTENTLHDEELSENDEEEHDPDYVLHEDHTNNSEIESDDTYSLHFSSDENENLLHENEQHEDNNGDEFAPPLIRPVHPPQPVAQEDFVVPQPQPQPNQQANINDNNVNVNDAGEEIAAQLQNEANDLQNMAFIANLHLTLSNLIVYSSIAFMFIGSYIFISYYIPTVIGYSLIKFYSLIISIFYRGLLQFIYISKLNQLTYLVLSKIPYSDIIVNWIIDNVSSNLHYYYQCYLNNTLSHSTIMRSLPAFTTYLTAVVLICVSSELISKGYNRRNGMTNERRRFIFQIFFALKCTFKVFTLFFIELAGFPILAGVMLDLSLIAPILGSLRSIVWIPNICTFWPQFALILYWTIGTLYMYWFAKYIGMIRQYLIRPGVLFFIRSPDDPNIKILHDSLIHPMYIQLSRLCLSMFIYAVFILAGFGFHTRFLFPFIIKSDFINVPDTFSAVNGFNIFTMFICFYIAKNIIEDNPNVKLAVRQYWIKVFEIISRRLRLSSFILGKDYSLERGHVLYRNYFYKFFSQKTAQWSNPDLFSNPKTEAQARQLFKENPAIHAYFIPDGTLMRVPSSDVVSRNYVQTMFVPVTKNDELLKPLDLKRIMERNKRNAGEFSYLDQQNTEFDDYFVCYVPPNFKFRYITLIALTWFFASTLIIAVATLSQYVFTIASLVILPLGWLFVPLDQYETLELIIFSSFKRANLQSVCLGAIMLTLMLDYYKDHELSRYFMNEHVARGANEANDEAHEDEQARPAPALAPAPGRVREIVFESFFIKGLIYMILLMALFIARFSFIMLLSHLFTFTVNFWLNKCSAFIATLSNGRIVLTPKGVIGNLLDICRTFDIFYGLVIIMMESKGIFRIVNERCATMIKSFWKKRLENALISLLKITIFTLTVVGGSVLSEYWFNVSSYNSFLQATDFVNLIYLRADVVTMTESTNIHSIIITIFTISFSLIYALRGFNIWIKKAVEDVKEHVYAKGRTLENYNTND